MISPWNYWGKEGNPNPKIPEARAALEKAFLLNRPDKAPWNCLGDII